MGVYTFYPERTVFLFEIWYDTMMSTYVRWTFCVLLPEKYDYSLNRNFLCTEISAEVLIIDTTTSIGCNGIQFLSGVYLICYTKQIYSTLHHVAVSRKQKTYFDPTAITDTLHGIHLKSMQFIHRGDLTISLSLFDCIMISLFFNAYSCT